MPDRLDMAPSAEGQAMFDELRDELLKQMNARFDAELRGERFPAARASAVENAAQIPGPGESSLIRRAGVAQEQAPVTKDRELGAVVVAAAATVVTGLVAAAVGYVQKSPETVLLVVVDLLPWLIGLAGVYIVCKTAARMAEKWR